MAFGLRALNRLASSELVDRFGLRESTERFLHGASKTTMRTAAQAGRTFAAAQRLSRPARQPRARTSDLFDLTPSDEQEMLSDSVRDFALSKLRPAAELADDSCAADPELLTQANELGLSMVGVPEELGGAVEQRSAVTSVLMSEALAQGDMGFAVACLAPAGVSTALGLWGDADQQATYLPEFVGENVPAAALALLEEQPLFNPFKLHTRTRRANGGFVLTGTKALVPRGADGELFIVAAELEETGPALFIVESKSSGITLEPEPAMGIRAAGTCKMIFEDTRLPAGALLAEGDPSAYADCVQLARLGWCAL
ncbi:MAG: acyl-CoA dehydrogenase family protein, partial [Solirubrobacterales bacterium]|nr:acyl-CoA dehydrogenase family protein [Solirubrobacterales bacterium]